jgi:murein L,D-transpeptidase YcbB/YkuD
MTVNLANDKDSVKKSKIDKKKLVNSINVKPEVPLFITYYTIYFDNGNQLVEYQDVYDFDEALIKELMPFVK